MEDSGFKVTDKRKLQSGDDDESTTEAATSSIPDSGAAASSATAGRGLPPPDFAMLVLSFSQSALMHLGELDDPEGAGETVDLEMARHSIDILGMLQEKTRGNLTTEESNLLENLLYDLRLKFVAKKRGG